MAGITDLNNLLNAVIIVLKSLKNLWIPEGLPYLEELQTKRL